MDSADFLNVPRLLAASQVQHRPPWAWYGIGGMLLVMGLTAALEGQSAELSLAVGALGAVAMLGMMVASGAAVMAAAKGQKLEQQQVEAVEELVQLRRWVPAAGLLEQLLGRPMRLPQHRAQALIYLASVLSRYHRFADAIAVQEYVLEQIPVDPMTAHGLRLGRAMSLLREDRLFDADRAINELRRSPMAGESGGLALVEMYRDVKTGHPVEALQMFEDKGEVMRQQLGHRSADAHALAARALDLLNRPEEAQRAYHHATLLSPPVELQRRYPELQALAERYQPALVPAELTGNGQPS